MSYEVTMIVCMGRIANQRKVPKLLPFKNYKSDSINILCTYCQGIDSFYKLLAITKLPNNELTSIHTRDLPPLLL